MTLRASHRFYSLEILERRPSLSALRGSKMFAIYGSHSKEVPVRIPTTRAGASGLSLSTNGLFFPQTLRVAFKNPPPLSFTILAVAGPLFMEQFPSPATSTPSRDNLCGTRFLVYAGRFRVGPGCGMSLKEENILAVIEGFRRNVIRFLPRFPNPLTVGSFFEDPRSLVFPEICSGTPRQSSENNSSPTSIETRGWIFLRRAPCMTIMFEQNRSCCGFATVLDGPVANAPFARL